MNSDLTLYTEFLHHIKKAIFIEDENRNITLCNQAFCDLFAIKPTSGSYINICSNHGEQCKNQILDPKKFISRIQSLTINNLPFFNELIEMKDGTFLERDYIPIFNRDSYFGNIWVYKKIINIT
ncbi:PAS domain-containing protein [Thiomicrorhabdus sp.]|uniref:PAS domain-containing protein n=1 Tax=Thiomicrorhabdus sp. TaxID=2039724 RepID=UPI002AA87DF9|nr:PAS domain-containing protein [Thiomicrorhabdus sp.]